MIGHNMYFDLLFLYSHFVENLPFTYGDFKKTLNKHFPEIFDTKFMINHTHLQKKLDPENMSSTLEILYKMCKDPANELDFSDVKVKLAPGFEQYDMDKPENALHFHEAGFDAYLTGYCFAKMFPSIQAQAHELKKIKNSVNVMRNFKYLKVSEEEDPYYNENILIFFMTEKLEENANKFIYTDILAKFENLALGDEFRIIISNSDTHNQAMIILETQDEKKKNLLATRIYGFEQENLEVASLDDYSKKIVDQKAAQKGKLQGASAPYKKNGQFNNSNSSNGQINLSGQSPGFNPYNSQPKKGK